MARNVEVKARVTSLVGIESRARLIATDGPVDIDQDDTFFACSRGRLKLRQFGDGRAELIHYFRENEAGPRVSDYLITAIESPAVLRESLSRALGIVGRVRKHRRLYLLDRTRVHLDVVEGLGCFVELEVVLADGESTEAGGLVARQLLCALGIAQGALVEGAYLDLATVRQVEPLVAR